MSKPPHNLSDVQGESASGGFLRRPRVMRFRALLGAWLAHAHLRIVQTYPTQGA